MPLTTTEKVHFTVGRAAEKVLSSGESARRVMLPPGRIPRIARWMALAIHLAKLLDKGEIENQAAIARAGKVTRARLSQIMSLVHLAPDLQEQLLSLPRFVQGREPIRMEQVIPMTKIMDWVEQRSRWICVVKKSVQTHS